MIERRGAVVVADGDAEERAHVVSTLGLAGYDTIVVENGYDALAAGARGDVGLVVLEVDLPGMSGLQVCSELRRQVGHDLPIVFVSGTRTDAVDRTAGLLLGADDYIVKPFDDGELLARVARFVSRAARMSGPEPDPRASNVTEREREVLDLLAQGLSQKEIALELTISSKTVATHIQNLLLKFGVHSRAELVAHAYRHGLVSPLHDRRRASDELVSVA